MTIEVNFSFHGLEQDNYGRAVGRTELSFCLDPLLSGHRVFNVCSVTDTNHKRKKLYVLE